MKIILAADYISQDARLTADEHESHFRVSRYFVEIHGIPLPPILRAYRSRISLLGQYRSRHKAYIYGVSKPLFTSACQYRRIVNENHLLMALTARPHHRCFVSPLIIPLRHQLRRKKYQYCFTHSHGPQKSHVDYAASPRRSTHERDKSHHRHRPLAIDASEFDRASRRCGRADIDRMIYAKIYASPILLACSIRLIDIFSLLLIICKENFLNSIDIDKGCFEEANCFLRLSLISHSSGLYTLT